MIKKLLLILVLLVAVFVGLAFYLSRKSNPNMIYGVNFSSEQAKWLSVDYQATFKTIVDEWNFKYIRVPAQWDTLEPERGRTNYTELDWIVNEADKRGLKLVIAVGQKTPRWPECHIPDWAGKLNDQDYMVALHNYIKEVVNRYKGHPSVEIWQVENEPFLSFGGGCKEFHVSMLKEEIRMVKETDPSHPTMVSDSGELSTWWFTARAADLFGTTLYRVVWDKHLGYFSYDFLPAGFYRMKLWLTGRKVSQAYIMELQAEPWLHNNNYNDTPIDEQNKSMSLKRLKKNVDFASRVGMPRAYLWGAEWWYWLRTKGYNDIPNYIKTLKKG